MHMLDLRGWCSHGNTICIYVRSWGAGGVLVTLYVYMLDLRGWWSHGNTVCIYVRS